MSIGCVLSFLISLFAGVLIGNLYGRSMEDKDWRAAAVKGRRRMSKGKIYTVMEFTQAVRNPLDE